MCWEAGGGGDFVSFITRPNQKVLYQWSRELQGEYDSMAENIFTSQGLGLCLLLKAICKTGLKTQGSNIKRAVGR